MSDYLTKIHAAVALIEEHNKAVTTKVDAVKFVECLKNSGATTDSLLNEVMYEDLVTCGLPVILARNIAKTIFRKPTSETSQPSSKYVSEKKVGSLTIQQLVESYDPVEFDNPVGKRLMEISKGQPCIAFDTNGSALVTASAKEIKSLREGFEPRTHVTVNDVPTKLYKIGDKPGNLLDENPLYPGRPLREGECDQTNRSWTGVDDVTRAVLHLAVTQTRELTISQLKDAHDTLDLVLTTNGPATIRKRFPKASLTFDELKAQNKLPSLKLARGSLSRKNNPFGNVTY